MAYWLKYYIRRSNAIVARSCEAGGRLRQRHGLIVKGKRISCPPHYAPPNNDYDPPHHDYEHGFPLIRSLRASTQRSTSVLFSFVLSLLIVAGSFAIRQSKTIIAILSRPLRFFEMARMLVRLDHVARLIVNANHGIM
jgi:hypothetical protein